jgi:glucose-6-phosphate isomerase
MSVYMIIEEILRNNFPETWKDHLIITTDEKKGFLRKLVNDYQITDFNVPDNVGGRFSVLSDVGLVSCAFLGIDIQELLNGAAEMKKSCESYDLYSNPAYLLGFSHYLFMQKGFNISVMMPYLNPLYDLADWYRQLWAESLGKRFDLKEQTTSQIWQGKSFTNLGFPLHLCF